MRPGNRSARIQVLVAEQAARRGARVGVVDVCTAAVAALPVGGAGLSAMSRSAASHPLCSTDDVSEQLEELQLTLGEGPCVDAFTQGSAVLTPDLLAAEVQDRWAVFADAALEAGARAVYAFPLQMGAISPGVLDLYSQVPGRLDAEALSDALAFADTAALVLLDSRRDGEGDLAGGWSADGRYEDLGAYRAEIDQATGMLTAQLGVGAEEAFVRLRAYAYARGRRLATVAADVVAHRLTFPPGADTDRTDDEA
ncbi:GAF and ANTAR domain-containing protein [Streptomyces olivochromogenes]|uniref:GAF and ANTAR domain-containing protein n=1 Tax=Streptomyces olivochromogenes TaxID=1963 RepID=UPI0036A5CB07